MSSGPYQAGMPAPAGMEKYIRPEHVARAAFLSQERRIQYQQGILNLWNKALSAPENSSDRITTCQKIAEITSQLQRQSASYRQQQQQQQQQAAQQGQHAAATPPNQPAQNNTQMQQQHQQQQTQQQQVQPQPASQPPRPASQDQGPSNFGSHGGTAQKKALSMVVELRRLLPNLIAPPGADATNGQKWVDHQRSAASTAISTAEGLLGQISSIQKSVIEKQKVSPLTESDKQKVQEKLQETYGRLNKMNDMMMRLRAAFLQNQRQGNGTPTVGVPTGPDTTSHVQPQIKSEPVDQSAAASQNPVAASPGQPSQPQHSITAPAAARPGSSQVNVPTKVEPGRPMPQPLQQPYALSHQDAVNAARSYQPSAQSSGPQHPHSGISRSDSGTKVPDARLPNQSRTLNVTPLQPVQMDPARPTMTQRPGGAAGVMNQPPLQKHPGYVLEGEGERVLSEKKLQELVREVTGSGGGSDGAESLDPEVRVTLLDLADEFIDNVVTAACKVAKLRNASTLDLRDIQLILERNYNIRVPGYASDELRTVKKIQPSQAWAQKMSAVQAAKVTGGKGDV